MFETSKSATATMPNSNALINKYRRYTNANVKGINESRAKDGSVLPLNLLSMYESADGKIDSKNHTKAYQASMLYENFLNECGFGNKAEAGAINETSRADIGGYIRRVLGMVKYRQQNNLLDKLIDEQVISGRTGRIYFMDMRTARAKGSLAAGQDIFSALNGFSGSDEFSSKNLAEPIGAAGGTQFNVTLGYGPVIPRSVRITAGNLTITDDGRGNLIGNIGAPTGNFTNTIDYVTGACAFVLSSAAPSQVVCNYQYNIEAAARLAEFGISLRHRDVVAQPRAVATAWSQQVLRDMQAEHGINLEPLLIQGGSDIIQAEKFKHILNILRNARAGGTFVFDNTPPVAITYQDHVRTFGMFVTRLQDAIFEETQCARPDTMVVSPTVHFMVSFQDGYEGIPFGDGNICGPVEVGRLTKHGITVIVDPTYNRDEGLLYHRGSGLGNSAAVCATYIDLLQSNVHSRYFKSDVAFLSEYAVEIINARRIGSFSVINL